MADSGLIYGWEIEHYSPMTLWMNCEHCQTQYLFEIYILSLQISTIIPFPSLSFPELFDSLPWKTNLLPGKKLKVPNDFFHKLPRECDAELLTLLLFRTTFPKCRVSCAQINDHTCTRAGVVIPLHVFFTSQQHKIIPTHKDSLHGDPPSAIANIVFFFFFACRKKSLKFF